MVQEAQPGPIDPGCVDDHEACEQWARSAECERNPQFMKSNCRASCHECNGGKIYIIQQDLIVAVDSTGSLTETGFGALKGADPPERFNVSITSSRPGT